MIKNVLITGINGFIGENLLDELTFNDYNIIGLDINKKAINKNINYWKRYQGNYKNFYHTDIRNHNDLENIFKNEKIDCVVHLAAQSGVQKSMINPIETSNTNVMGTLNLLDLSKKYNIKKFILASSGCVLGDKNPPFHEKMTINPISVYGASKASCEHYCNAFNNSFDLDTTILRFNNVYGRHSLHKKGNLIPEFILSWQHHKPFKINGNGEQTRDFIYVDDVVSAIIKVIESTNCFGETFHVGTGIETSINELVKLMQKTLYECVNDVNEIEFSEELSGDVKRNYSIINKIKTKLLWEPKYTLIQGIEEMFQFYLI